MSLPYEPDTLILPEPIGLQPEWLASASARKVLRIGRRGSKTRFAMVAGIAGHGPGYPDQPSFGGILDGGDVLWVAVDYPQLTTVLWKEELVPRFGDLSWATLNTQQHNLEIPGKGTLFLRSAEALRGVRGMGKNLKGVIVDEAAHFDLEGALLNEVLPTLLDNDGWLVIMSTTNAGPDGNSDKRVPSFFNCICEAINAGDPRYEGWEQFYGTAFDNPVINDKAINELIGLYPEGSPALEQEVYARLIKAGVGLALPQVTAEKHLVDRFPIPDYWEYFAAFDWGYNHWWCFSVFTSDTDGNVYLVDTLWGRLDEPAEIARKITHAFPFASQFKGIYAGHDIWQQKGKAIGANGPTIYETLWNAGLKMSRAAVDRVQGLNNLRAYIEWRASDRQPIERIPRFRMFRTDGNRRVLQQLVSMQLDPKNLEDALKMDADSSGKGGDDGYDTVRYGLMSRPLKAKIGVKYQHEGQEPHHDPNVKLTTVDGKPPTWIGPGDDGYDGMAMTGPTGGFDDYLPTI